MGKALRGAPLVLVLCLLPLPVSAGGFLVSLPADSAVTVEAPSRLLFTVTNRDAREGLSRLTFRFLAGYRITAGSPPSGWTVELGSSAASGDSGEISFRTTDDVQCTAAIAPGTSLVFGIEVIAPASRSLTPDSLVSAQGEQSCRGVALDPPVSLPSWDRMGLDAALTAGPPLLGPGGVVTVTMTLTNLSTVELAGISPLLSSTGTGSVSRMTGPTPPTLILAPGTSASVTWVARAASAGALSFSGQAVSKNVTSSPVRSETLFVGDLEVSLSTAPEQVPSGGEVQVQMTVRNRGPAGVANVVPSALAVEGTATMGLPTGPSPASQPVLEPGAATTFTWVATVSGRASEDYAFSGWASAEGGAIASQVATSNRGTVVEREAASAPDEGKSASPTGGGGLAADDGGAAATTSTGGTPPTPGPTATLQFIGVNHNGTQIGGADFSGSLLGDLRILVGWQNLAGTHTQRLDFFSPDGSLYQRLSTQFTQSPVETQLLVGGTWITQYSLFGAWRVELFLDGGASPVTSGVFVLNP